MLTLHIGTGKAGSTTIQDWLQENRDAIPCAQLPSLGSATAWKAAIARDSDHSH